MESCKEINELIPLYAGGELGEGQRSRLEEHIKGCRACKDELEDIIYIINLCNDVPEEELPENFRAQLHEKLVREKEKQERTGKVAYLRNKYVKILSTIAAGLLIVALLRGFTNNGLLMTGRGAQNESVESKAVAEAAKSAGMAESGDTEAADVKALQENPEVQSDAGAEAGIMKAPAQTPKADTSRFFPSQRIDNDVRAEEKIINSRSAAITLGTVSSVEPEEVKELALKCDAELESSAMAQGDAVADGSVSELRFKVPNQRYEELVNLLTASFEQYGVEVGPLNVQDMTQAVNDLESKLIGLEDSIDAAENNKNISSPEELSALKADREKVMAELERIHLNSGYTFVTITIK